MCFEVQSCGSRSYATVGLEFEIGCAMSFASLLEPGCVSVGFVKKTLAQRQKSSCTTSENLKGTVLPSCKLGGESSRPRKRPFSSALRKLTARASQEPGAC